MKKIISGLVILGLFTGTLFAQGEDSDLQSGGLILTENGAREIHKLMGELPILDKSLEETKRTIDKEMKSPLEVPIPKDLAGGYTHERHKRNFYMAQGAGVLFQITKEEKYGNYVKDMLLEYARIFPDLPLHPQERSYSRGKLFWQALNDANWLVYMSQAYASIYDYISDEEREKLENDLFRPFADFLSVENPKFFNRIHNHSTWGNAAVGMIGLVMNDEELIERALYGLEEDNIEAGEKDDDGGLIKKPGQNAGFLANIDQAFSPTGYYTEGPYYQRYAMYPFMIFAAGLENKRPDLQIFEFKDGVLIKAVKTLLNLTDTQGNFFPINDAQKGMSYYTKSLINVLNIAYKYGDQDASLLSIAIKQGSVGVDDSGLEVAKAIKNDQVEQFEKRSMEFTDGNKGDKGGLAVIRAGNLSDTLSLLMKYSSQGDSHGHYDKLSFSLYNNDEEVIQDYGLARFVNVAQKNGGGYLKENTTWAKQTIAHNTVVQNEESHFRGDYETGSKFHSEKYFLDFEDEAIQIVSAKDKNAYPGTEMHRTMAVIKHPKTEHSFILDIFRVNSEEENQYDLPFYYFGQIIDVNVEYKTPDRLEKLGVSNGYQHLWKEAEGKGDSLNTKFTWLDNRNFYTLTSTTDTDDKIMLARTGASDPEFNLRRDPTLIVRRNAKKTTFVSSIEGHGKYNPISEIADNAFSQIKELKLINDSRDYTAVQVTFENPDLKRLILVIANQDPARNTKHKLKLGSRNYTWTGPYHLVTN